MEKKKTNFSEEERAVLLELVARHRSVVENKKTDAVSVSRKRDTWKKIEEEYKSRHNVTPRTSAQLKKCWENLKDKWRRCNAEDMRERFSTGGGPPQPSQVTDEMQLVGAVASHMAIRLPNPYDSDRSRHSVVPGGPQSSQSQCTPAVVALLSQTQDGPVGDASGCEDVVDEPPEYWSWDDVDGTEATGARSHDNEPATADGRPGAPEAPEAPGAPEASGDLAPTSSDVPAGKRRPASKTRQAAVSLELAARLSAIKEDREEKKQEHLLKLKYMRIEHRQNMQLIRLKKENQKAKAQMLKLQLDFMRKQYD